MVFTYFNVFQLSDSSKTFPEWLNQPALPSLVYRNSLLFHIFRFIFILLHETLMFISMLKIYRIFCQKEEMNLVEEYQVYSCAFNCHKVGVQLCINHIDLLEVLLSVSWLSNLLLNCLPLMEQCTFSVQHSACHLIGWVWRLIHCWPSIQFEKTAFIWIILLWLEVHLIVALISP